MTPRVLIGLGLGVLLTAAGLGIWGSSQADPSLGHEEPRSVTAVCSASSADVSWAAVSDAHLSGFDVYYRVSGQGNWIESSTQLVLSTLYTVTGLAGATPYDFAVVAVYSDGHVSPMSVTASCTT